MGDALFGGDALLGGYFLGLIVIFLIAIAMTWLIGPYAGKYGFIIGAGTGMMFVTLIQWWDMWPIIATIVLMLFAVTDPLGLKK